MSRDGATIVDVETISIFSSVGTLMIGVLVVAAIALGATSLGSERVAGWQRAVAEAIGDQALWLAWLAALLGGWAACTTRRLPASNRANCAGSSESPCTRWP